MPYYPRLLEGEIREAWEGKGIHIVRGPRRSGKTTLLLHLKELYGGTYVSFDDPAERREFLTDPIRYASTKGFPLFLDEIQHLNEEGALALKRIYDRYGDNAKVVVSGSGAFDVKMGLLRHLVGRAYIYDLLPLSFEEFLLWKDKAAYRIYREGKAALLALMEGSDAVPKPSPLVEKYFNEYLIYGGYPAVVLKEGKDKERELIATVNTTIMEDIIAYFSLRRKERLWEFVERLAAITGNLLHLSTLGLPHQTAEEYLAILQQSFILSTLRPFSTNKLVELSKARKLYFYDNGFRNALLHNLRPIALRTDRGPLLENALHRQLLPYGELRYWRTKSKAEVDFILLREGGQPLPIEVKAGQCHAGRSLLSFIERYQPPVALVACNGTLELKRGSTRIVGVPAYYF